MKRRFILCVLYLLLVVFDSSVFIFIDMPVSLCESLINSYCLVVTLNITELHVRRTCIPGYYTLSGRMHIDTHSRTACEWTIRILIENITDEMPA